MILVKDGKKVNFPSIDIEGAKKNGWKEQNAKAEKKAK